MKKGILLFAIICVSWCSWFDWSVRSMMLQAESGLATASFYERGEKLFRENKPQDAIALLEQAIRESQVDERAWIYLGLSYQQLGRYDDALASFTLGLSKSQRFRALFYFDIGNIYVLQNRDAKAIEAFTAAMTYDPQLAAAYLNRGNTKVRMQDLEGALQDYKKYLELNPQNAQKAGLTQISYKLETVLQGIAQQKAEEEARRIAEENARQALRDRLSSSLQDQAGNTSSLSAGAGQIQGYDSESQLDE